MHGRFHRAFADTHGRGQIRVGLRGALAHQTGMEFGEKSALPSCSYSVRKRFKTSSSNVKAQRRSKLRSGVAGSAGSTP
jgi:hypothetical protein